jgi:signal transduction histidine kinase
MKLKIPMISFGGYSLAILVFVLLVKFGFISTEAIGISVSSLEIVLIIYALALGLVQLARQSFRLKNLSLIATNLGSGQLNKRSEDLNFDAIGNLAHALNKMADQIQKSFDDLREAGDNLEEPLQYDDRHFAPGKYIQMSVTDDGTGMEDATMDQIFEPFFTTKKSEDGQSGTGLGLSTVYGIMKQHQGWISVKSRPEIGTRFDLFFPVLNEDTESPVS